MTLPSSGVLAASAVNTELQASSSAPFQMSDAVVRYLAKKQAAGSPISMADLRGRSFTAALSDINPSVGADNVSTSNSSVAVSDNGNTMVVLASSNRTIAPTGELTSGGMTVLVYERNSSGVFVLNSTFVCRSFGGFGNIKNAACISADGTRIVVSGALGPGFTDASTGSFWHYRGALVTLYKSSGSWVQGTDVLTDVINWSGYQLAVAGFQMVSMSADGSTIVASTEERSDVAGGGTVGAVYVYSYAGSGTWTRTQKIKPSGTTSNPWFNAQLSADGNTLLTTASSFSSNYIAWVYKKVAGTYTFFTSYTPSLSGVVTGDADINGSSSFGSESPYSYSLSRDGTFFMVRVYAVKSGVRRKRVVVCGIGVSSVTQDAMFKPVPSSFGMLPGGTEEFTGTYCISGDGTRACFALRTLNSYSEGTTGTYLLFWFKHPTTGVWTYQGSAGVTYPSASNSNPGYSIPALDNQGSIGVCSSSSFSPNVVVQITS